MVARHFEENAARTGRAVGVVVADLINETVSVRIEDCLVESVLFKTGRWRQPDEVTQTVRARDGVCEDLTAAQTGLRRTGNGGSLVRASFVETQH